MSKVIDATLRFVDKFTSPMNNAISTMQRSARQAQRMGSDIQKAGNKISSVGSSLTMGVTAPIAAAGVASFKLASDMSESLNKVDVAFGKNADGVKKWSESTLTQYGLSQGSALEMASLYGDMASGMGINSDASTEMSESLTGLAADLSSYKNVSTDVASGALKGIFTGEGESLKSMGIIMNDTTLKQYALAEGYKTKYADMTQAEKVQLRYNYVMNATKDAQGDFARTSDGAANQQRIFTESLKEVGTTIGTKLLPIGTKLITWVNSMVSKFSNLSDKQLNMIIKFAGIAAAIGPVVLVIGKMTSGVGKAISLYGKIGGAISKAGSVMGLFTSPAFIVVAVIVAIAVAAFLIIKNWDKVKAFLIKLGASIKSIFVKSGGDVGKFSKLFEKAKEVISNAIENLRPAIANIITFMKPIVLFLSSVFVANFKIGFAMISGVVSAVVDGIGGYISGLLTVFDGITMFIGGVFTGNWSKAWEGVKTIFSGVFESFSSIAKIPLNAVIGLINGAISGINKLGLTIPDWVPGLGGKSFSISVPTIPMLAKGTKNWGGGLAITQDRGGEIMDLPRGTRVYPHDKSIAMARAEGANNASGGTVINISRLADKIEVRSDEDIDRIVKILVDKLESVINNTGKAVLV